MKIKLTVRDDRGIALGGVELSPRVPIDPQSFERISTLRADLREKALQEMARDVGRSIGTEEVFQLLRIAAGK